MRKATWYSIIFAAACLVALNVPVLARTIGQATLKGEVKIGGQINHDHGNVNRAAEYKSNVKKNNAFLSGGSLLLDSKYLYINLDGNYVSGDEQKYGGNIDLNRFVRYTSSYNRFLHRLDHDTLDNLSAWVLHSPQTLDPSKDPNWENIGPSLFPTGNIYRHKSPPYEGIWWRPVPGTGTMGYGEWTDVNNNKKREGGLESIGGAALFHQDYNPNDDYRIVRSEWKNRVDFSLPFIPGTKLTFNHRMEQRKGYDQARTMSKCGACHVTSQTKGIDEHTNEYGGTLSTDLGPVSLVYSYMHRDFDDSSDDMFNLYDEVHPGREDIVYYRLLYDREYGTLPYNRIPDSEKDMHVVKLKYDLNSSNSFALKFLYSKYTNNNSDEGLNELYGNFGSELEAETYDVDLSWMGRLTSSLSATAKFRYYNIDNDDVDVHLFKYQEQNQEEAKKFWNQPNDVIKTWGASKGMHITDQMIGFYRTKLNSIDTKMMPRFQDYSDYERQSSLDRDVYDFELDFSWLPASALTINAGYHFNYIDRDNADEWSVTDTTTTHSFKASADWNKMCTWGVDFHLDYALTYVDDPYTYKDASCTTAGGFTNPATGGPLTQALPLPMTGHITTGQPYTREEGQI